MYFARDVYFCSHQNIFPIPLFSVRAKYVWLTRLVLTMRGGGELMRGSVLRLRALRRTLHVLIIICTYFMIVL